MLRQGIWHFALIFLFTICLTNTPTTGQHVQFAEQDNFLRGLGDHLILIFAPGMKSPPQLKAQPDLPTYKPLPQTELSDSSSSDEDLNISPKDDDVYYLYHALRTAKDNENLDNRVMNSVERTKGFLRQMLRARCNKLQECMDECPKKKKKKCAKSCKIKIDVYAVCEEEEIKKCRPPKCGRTMPPRW